MADRKQCAPIQGGLNESTKSITSTNAKTGSLVDVFGVEVLIPAPANALEIRPRKCGDFYAEVRGKDFCVAGYGKSEADAAKDAARKVPA